ncbi:unnamed protein product [Vitrella brassicaformis CCMP3155]|uniref:5'-deoxynucleotidase n=2 Tax=Vitrella brassicaformis TaxID=1169539 RepID=A0A0G4EPK2_VITBC|nr:unnamed protein product [Vitrella brassicaformis CCMP3155]|mmetsp:Transcript_5671/g.13519  ORF Transcript_5671/g.13519 Transcript_5671/m.13519 type:complete len:233 (+) Transcript_5671:101-799(+)|eukprot:CEL99190.1 unnamed protein product [Vitrella brassicaformis CCMP3155]
MSPVLPLLLSAFVSIPGCQHRHFNPARSQLASSLPWRVSDLVRMGRKEELDSIIKFLQICGKLKRVKRTGWVRAGVEQPESVAEHMYRMAMACFLLPTATADRNKCVKMALVHDLAEWSVGDITPFCGVPKEEKSRREKAAMAEVRDLVGGDAGQEIFDLWLEYEMGTSEEARFVRDIDKFEMVLQAFEYETEQKLELPSFYDTTRGVFKTDLFRSLDQHVRDMRDTAPRTS